jgi:hypothetical protein
MPNPSEQQRIEHKSYHGLWTVKLCQDFSLSLAEAKVLSTEILEEQTRLANTPLQDQEIWFTCIAKHEPAGKRLKDCEKVRVRLALTDNPDDPAPSNHARIDHLVHRLCWQALKQGGVLSNEDLARILFSSEKTIRRILEQYRKRDIFIPTRGNYRDIGPGTSHKVQAVKLFLKAYTPTRIAAMLGHHVMSIERYLRDFCTVMAGHEEGFAPLRIARSARMSEGLVRQYLELYTQFSAYPEYAPVFEALRLRFEHGKKNGGRI